MKMKLVAIIQPANRGLATNYSAYCPDIPGCIAHGSTEEKALAALQSTLAHQVHTLEELGAESPKHQCKVKVLEVEIREMEQDVSDFSNLIRLH
jgi:predicted RNase H-like HicB family nuclease